MVPYRFCTVMEHIEEAEKTLRLYHDVDPSQRQAIYMSLGPWGGDTIGYRRRTGLALLSARYVLPLVERLLPRSRSADLLTMAEQVLAGRLDRHQMHRAFLLHSLEWGRQDRAALRALLKDQHPIGALGADEAYNTVEQVSLAALRALDVALFDDFNPAVTLPGGWRGDTAGWAWVASREQWGTSDPARTRLMIQSGDAFWRWWLKEAVRLAWFSVQEN